MAYPSFLRTSAIQLSVLLIIAAQTYHGVIIQIQAADYDISTLGVGVITSAFYIGYFVSCIFTKRFVAAWGHIRGHALMTTVYGLATLLFPIAPGVIVWSVLYGICGMATGGMFVIFETWLNFATDNKGRSQTMAFYIMMITLGKIIGNYAFNYVSIFSFSHYSYITMFILASMLPLLTTMLQQPHPVSGDFLSFRAVYRISPAAFVVLFLSQLGSSAASSLGAILGKLLGFNSWHISDTMSVIFLAAIVIQMPLGRLSNKIDRRLVMLWVALFMIIGNILFLSSPIDTFWFWVSMVLLGGTIYNFYPLAMAHFNDLLHEKHRAAINAQLLLVASVGQTIGPMITSFFLHRFHYRGFAIALLIEASLILLFLVNRLRIRKHFRNPTDIVGFVADLPMAPSVVQPITLKEPRKKSPKKLHRGK